MTGKDEPPFKDWRNRITSMRTGLALVPISLVGKGRLGDRRGPGPAAQRDAPCTRTDPRAARRVPPVPRSACTRDAG